MKSYFKNTLEFDSDCYVADFTEETHSERGVEISDKPFEELSEDISYFHLEKKGKGNLRYLVVNLEENESFTKGIDNCECIFESLAECHKPWLMLLEMKYCDPKNTDKYVSKACRQMKETAEKLDELEIVKLDERRIYFVYSVPRNSESGPFGSFETTPEDITQFMEKHDITYYGYNSVLIATANRLHKPYLEVD